MLGLANHPPWTAPAVESFVLEFGEDPSTLSGFLGLRCSLSQFRSQNRFQPGIARQPENEVDVISFTPVHQPISAETGIGSQNDTYLRPALANLSNDPLNFLQCAGRSIDIGPPQTGPQQLVTAKNVEWQIAVVIVEAMKETSLLPAVDRKISRVQIQHDLIGRCRVRLQKHIHHQSVDGFTVAEDLLIPVFFLS